MAPSIDGLPHRRVSFEADGRLISDDGAAAPVPRDLYVFCHGWNTSAASAADLGVAMARLIAAALPAARRSDTGFLTVGWPSLLFPEDEPAADGPVLTGAGAAQSAGGPPPRAPDDALSTGADLVLALVPAFPTQKEQLVRIGTLLDTRPQRRARLVELHELVSGLVTTPNDAAEDRGEDSALHTDTATVLDALAALAPATDGGVQGLGPFDALWSGGRELLRVLSYYEMKNRAGVIGRVGLGPLLAGLPGDPRVHLVGHSFGARMVSYALTAPGWTARSLLLVQGAFSHFAFAPELPFDRARAGGLGGASARVAGPLAATFSPSDRAVGWWYPNASRLARQDSQGVIVPGHRWGAMGHDGFQQGGVVDRRLSALRGDEDWAAGVLHRIDAGDVINRGLSWFAGSHSDIRKAEIGRLAVALAG